MPSPLPVVYQIADATALPFPTASFDMALVVHLFYFVPQWRRAVSEPVRVVKVGRPIILMHTGYGTEVPWLIEQYKAKCAANGYPAEHIGARSTQDVMAYAESVGCHVEGIRDRWRWLARIPLEQALSHLGARAYSCTTVAPDGLRRQIMAALRADALEHFGSLDCEAEVPNQISLAILTRSACGPVAQDS